MREKLMELVYAARVHADEECDKQEGCSRCPYDAQADMCQNGPIVDHLLANGVVVQRWIPVTERLPENDQRVLCFNYNGEYKVLRWNYIDWMWNSGIEWLEEKYVTHWMPLPEPPKEGE